MARSPRHDFPGAWHHVMNRGTRREPIFTREAHCTSFLDALGEMTDKALLEVHAYSLMPNHFHLLVRSPEGTLSRGMKLLQARHALQVNRLEGWDGPLFRGRFKNQVVTRDDYLRALVAYIHLNPLRAHLVASLEEPSWTSFRAHAGLEEAPPWLSRWAMRQWFGEPRELAKWVKSVQIGRAPYPEELDLETGWILAGTSAAEPTEPAPEAAGRLEHPEHLDALLARISAVTGAPREALRASARGRGANQARRFAALTLMREGLGHGHIARTLGMTAGALASLAFRARKATLAEQFPAWVEAWDHALEAPPTLPTGKPTRARPSRARSR